MRTLAIIAAVGFIAIAVFQAALALGGAAGTSGLGRGRRTHLSPGLRVASGIAALFWLLAGAVVLARSGVGATFLPDVVARWETWILVVVLAIGAVIYAASSSPWERYLGAPLALVLAVVCFFLARG